MTDETAARDSGPVPSAADEQLLTELARSGGLKLTGEGRLLGHLTKMVVEVPWKASYMTTPAMPSATQLAVMAGIPATARLGADAGGDQLASGAARHRMRRRRSPSPLTGPARPTRILAWTKKTGSWLHSWWCAWTECRWRLMGASRAASRGLTWPVPVRDPGSLSGHLAPASREPGTDL